VAAEITKKLQPLACCQLLKARQIALGLGKIHLVGHQDLGALRQLRAVQAQLGVDFMIIFHRIPALKPRSVNDVQKEAGSFHVPQKLRAQTHARVGPFNQAGNIRKHKGMPLIQRHHAQVRP